MFLRTFAEWFTQDRVPQNLRPPSQDSRPSNGNSDRPQTGCAGLSLSTMPSIFPNTEMLTKRTWQPNALGLSPRSDLH